MLPIATRSTLARAAGAANSEASRIGSSFCPFFILEFPPVVGFAAPRLFFETVTARLRLPYGRLKRTPYLTPPASDPGAAIAQRYPRVARAAAALACLVLLPL